MRYMLMFVLAVTTLIAQAQSVNKPKPETAPVNSQSGSSGT